MIADLREYLYYPLGIIPSIFFSLRFILQWIKSEKLKVSHINPTFWKLSLCGNVLATLHYFVQFQFTFFIIQFINSFISRRNLITMKVFKRRFPLTVEIVLFSLLLVIFSAAFFFCCDFKFNENSGGSWMLHLLGICGGFLFASRFWVQWWTMEKTGISALNKQFWVLSILGGALTIIYTLAISDVVSTFNYLFGMVPYIRNLILIKNSDAKKNLETS
jgi:lipid-A-disaccharide synthase-like uncharacterized protein